ncbi:DUF2207 domain-containing protein [Sinorhizobium mexicanum]|uniref:DUF2207 domain-containing protein n=1 Tax=Sinorhizobium mexicanum TaxID=375549 RepID=A0A859QL35_9HYPH|nr:DUF2207 domain-containing protein [Sinorhizobium mexicanum]MBP1883084.1 putative membrane protein YgcG [Sinorhizobium mexicanum]QLL60786.1 DUF2207 domain-containing protein [Sinorhizobium mexicanum]
MKRLSAAVALVLLVLVWPLTAAAQEIISSFHSVIEVAKDGTLTVTETIAANVEGSQIRRGIYRDFPLTFIDANGRRSKVDFDLISVERDGEEESYRTETIDGGIRIYTGKADVFLPRGEHTFQITYETSRQIRFFDDHDELYWNVTGTEWVFPIEEATATVTLPEGVKAQALDVFTGGYGATGKDARAVEEGDEIFFATTRRLRPQEGLTIAVKMPKGSIDRPSASQENIWWLRDHLALVIAGAGLVLVALYYGRAWVRVGRDPARGVMVPRWDAPDGISPALVNYIDNKGFSGEGWTALSAAALNLAVKGHVVLEDLKKAIVITATGKGGAEKLPTGEATLMKAIGTAGGKLTIDRANGKKVAAAGSAFRSSMEREHRGKYYRANTAYIVGGVLLSLLAMAALFIFGDLSEESIPLVMVPVFIAFFVSIFAVSFGKSLRRGSSLARRIMSIVVLAFFAFVFLTIFSGVLAAIVFSATGADDLPLLFAVGGIVLVNVLFFFLMGAPTPLGTRMMDGIDGLRQYMTLAEQDRMNLQGAPEMSPRHFETLLPYAVALGVEKPWTETFDRWLLAASAGAAAAAAYHPSWYHGDSFGPGSFGDRIGGFAGSMADTMTSSLPPPPKSSSSGFSTGGGFSGGGGGGGGGGGW